MNRFFRLSMVVSVLLLSACSQEDPPSDRPRNVTVVAGESLIAVDWDTDPGRTYWIYYKTGTHVSLDDKDVILYDVRPPYLIGLTNGTQYAVAVTSSQDGSPVGPFSPVQTATPRLLGPGVPWFVGASLSANDLRSIAYGSNTYVTTGDAATVFIGEYSYTSDTGVTSWKPPTTLPVNVGPNTNLTAVIFDGTRFMALGDDGSITKTSSADFLTWEEATAITGAPPMNALAQGSGLYLAVGNTGAIYTNASGGVTDNWTSRTSGTVNDLYGVAFVNNRFIVVGENGTLLTSIDGINWNLQSSNTGNALRHVAYGADRYVAVGDAGTIVDSTDASIWNVQAAPTTESFRSIVFAPDQQFIAVGTAGMLAYSTTGVGGSWTTSNAGSADLNSLAPNQVLIAVGSAGANVSGK